MFLDVRAACEQVGDVIVCDAPGGQGAAVAATLARLEGPVAIVNADLPCVTPYELHRARRGGARARRRPDGTTNALALADARDFRPLYGPGSADALRPAAARSAPACARTSTRAEDLVRLAPYVGPNTRSAMLVSA